MILRDAQEIPRRLLDRNDFVISSFKIRREPRADTRAELMRA
jgi:hypothetical protein